MNFNKNNFNNFNFNNFNKKTHVKIRGFSMAYCKVI